MYFKMPYLSVLRILFVSLKKTMTNYKNTSMKTLGLCLGLTLFSVCISYAQVGIGTTTPNATLDIVASNQATPSNTDGILIPKIDEFPTTNPTAAQDSMLVYATGNGSIAKGFYFWEQSSTTWQPLLGINDAWTTTGNAGTLNGTNFIGTTDIQDLDIRTNNVIRHRFTQQGQLEFLNSGGSVFIGEGAGANDNLTNNNNTFVGTSSGTSNTLGVNNSFVGTNSGFSNTSGGGNSFLDLEVDWIIPRGMAIVFLVPVVDNQIPQVLAIVFLVSIVEQILP